MRKGLLAICAVLVVSLVLLAVLVPSCAPTTGTIVVKATLCGNPWPTQGTGAVNYTLTPGTGSPISGTSVPTTHSAVTPGTWTCTYVAGGPAGAFLNSIKPLASQSLVAGGTITFTLDFELKQDAAIQFQTWTINAEPFDPGTYEGAVCNIIDVHFTQWVNGCEGYNVTMDETSWLMITQTAGPAATVVVVDDWCAVNKTAPQAPTPVKKSQVPTVDNVTRSVGDNVTLVPEMPTQLDVHTQWQLVKGANYTKSINWFGISKFEPVPGHDCVLFELVLPVPGFYQFTLQASAQVALVDDEDVNPDNNLAMSPPLPLIIWLNVG